MYRIYFNVLIFYIKNIEFQKLILKITKKSHRIKPRKKISTIYFNELDKGE